MGDFNNPTRPARHWIESQLKDLQWWNNHYKSKIEIYSSALNEISEKYDHENASIRELGQIAKDALNGSAK